MNKGYINVLFRSIRDQVKQCMEADISITIRPELSKEAIEMILPIVSYLSRLPLGMKNENDMDEEERFKMMEFTYVIFLMIDAYCEQEGVDPLQYYPKGQDVGYNDLRGLLSLNNRGYGEPDGT